MNSIRNAEPEKSLFIGDYQLYYLWFCFNNYVVSEEPDYKRYSALKEYTFLSDLLYRKMLEKSKRQQIKRKNELKSIILNVKFKGSCKHHMDINHVLHIPEELHTSISHSIFTGKGMNEINEKVVEWYEGSHIPYYISIRSS